MQSPNRYIAAFLCLLSFAVLVAGCKKDNTPSKNKPTLIISSTMVDGSNLADTVNRYDFEYDNTNRLAKVYKSSSSTKKFLYLSFSYDASGNMTNYTLNSGNSPAQNGVVTFNGSLPVTETITQDGVNASYIRNFQYSNSNNTVVITENIDTLRRDTLQYQNNNLLYHGEKFGNYAPGIDTLISISRLNTTYTYGNNKGPYASLNLKYYFNNGIPYVSANEVTSIAVKSDFGYGVNTSTGTSTYLFNSQGYPTKKSDFSSGSSQVQAITYFAYKQGN